MKRAKTHIILFMAVTTTVLYTVYIAFHNSTERVNTQIDHAFKSAITEDYNERLAYISYYHPEPTNWDIKMYTIAPSLHQKVKSYTIRTRQGKYMVKEFDNPADSTIGASFVNLGTDDGKEFQFGYNGEVRVLVNHAVKEIKIDNFTTRPLPVRPLSPPFFNYCKNIVRYALETEDSIATTLEDCGDYFHFKLVINENTQVEFFGKAYHMPPPPFYVEPTSIYELWIHKSNGLPYKKRRAMSHDISVETCCNVEINKET